MPTERMSPWEVCMDLLLPVHGDRLYAVAGHGFGSGINIESEGRARQEGKALTFTSVEDYAPVMI